MMREPVDLRRAVKEEVGKDLADFTFTPAMQQRVLAQIEKRPRSRMSWLYPASAAAAVLLILVTSTSFLRQDKAEQHQATASGGAQEQANAPIAPSGNEAIAATSAPTPEPAPTERSTDQFDVQVTDGIGNAIAASPAPDTFHALTAPGPTAKMGKQAFTGPQMAAIPSQHLMVTLSGSAVTWIDPNGAPVWQVALPATLKAEQVVAAPNGKIVVSAGSKVLLLGPDGSMLESVQLQEPVMQIATGSGDQLALVSAQAVYVRQNAGQPPIAIGEANVSAATFTPEGLLLLVTQDGLAAYGSNGNRRWLATGDGGPLLVSKEGKVLLWGNSLYRYDTTGAAPTAVEPAAGVMAGGPGLLRWDGEQLKAITWAGKQAWTWTAPGFIYAIYQGDGERLWAVLDTPDGFKLQELKGATGRPVGEARTLPTIPQEAIVMDGKLYLRLPDGLTVLSL